MTAETTLAPCKTLQLIGSAMIVPTSMAVGVFLAWYPGHVRDSDPQLYSEIAARCKHVEPYLDNHNCKVDARMDVLAERDRAHDEAKGVQHGR